MADSRASFYTPHGVTQAILPHLHAFDEFGLCSYPNLQVLEPCAGGGAILDVLLSAGVDRDNLSAVEIRHTEQYRLLKRAATVQIGDIFQVAKDLPQQHYNLIITNPPFGETIRLYDAVAPLLATGGQIVMLERCALMESLGRARFHWEHPSQAYVLTRRPSFVPSGKIDRWAYSWFTWTPDDPTATGWMPLDWNRSCRIKEPTEEKSLLEQVCVDGYVDETQPVNAAALWQSGIEVEDCWDHVEVPEAEL